MGKRTKIVAVEGWAALTRLHTLGKTSLLRNETNRWGKNYRTNFTQVYKTKQKYLPKLLRMGQNAVSAHSLHRTDLVTVLYLNGYWLVYGRSPLITADHSHPWCTALKAKNGNFNVNFSSLTIWQLQFFTSLTINQLIYSLVYCMRERQCKNETFHFGPGLPF